MLNHVLTLLMGVTRQRVPADFVFVPDAAYRPRTLTRELEAARAVWVPPDTWEAPGVALDSLMLGITSRLHAGRFDALTRLPDRRTTYDDFRMPSWTEAGTAVVVIEDPSGTLGVRVTGDTGTARRLVTASIRGSGTAITISYTDGSRSEERLIFTSGVSAPVRIRGTDNQLVFTTAQSEYPSTALTTFRVYTTGHSGLAQRVDAAVRAYRPGALITQGYDDPVDNMLDTMCTDNGVALYRESALALLTARAIEKAR